MTDVAGNELEVGQTVATNHRGYTQTLILATVVGFTPKKVVLEFQRKCAFQDGVREFTQEIKKFPKQVAIVNL